MEYEDPFFVVIVYTKTDPQLSSLAEIYAYHMVIVSTFWAAPRMLIRHIMLCIYTAFMTLKRRRQSKQSVSNAIKMKTKHQLEHIIYRNDVPHQLCSYGNIL